VKSYRTRCRRRELTLPTKNAVDFEPFTCLDNCVKYKILVAKLIKYLQTKFAEPAFNEGFLGRMGTCPNLSAKTKVFGVVVDTRPGRVLDVYIKQRPCVNVNRNTHVASFCHNTILLASVCIRFASILLGFTIAWCNAGGYLFSVTLCVGPVCFRGKSCLFRLRFQFAGVLPLLRDQLLVIGIKNMMGSICLLVQVTGKFLLLLKDSR